MIEMTTNRIEGLLDINWEQVIDYGISLLITILVTYLILYVVRLLIAQFFRRTNFISEKKEQTIESVVKNTSHYLAFFIIVLAALRPFVDIKDILVAGGVIGIVVGLGAQKIMTDILAGFFMIFEEQFQRGDFVHINGELEGGTIEDLGFRVVKVRLLNGKLMTVPNGEIRKVENGNVEKRRIFESVIVSFKENPSRIENLLQEVCNDLNEHHKQYLKKDPITGEYVEVYQVHGLSSLDVSPLGYRFSIKATVSDDYYLVAAQQTKKRLAQKIYDEKILMPTQQVVLQQTEREYEQ
ncbi:mechanosensitive ion channel family protein [Mesobacillus maritimus]|uniref:Mechanosensitive ion channel family protein n=1 Tax=Mesobacillus maritimus TaxID=1643336 RepID=A0ABS7K6A8_9BACI|nr:mechanosensitive ion channel family protein [Mesobacillus maritimus]MBY0097796.1 mechanosensitive ion channel family protein [Mesobacillus maritimus]